MAKRPCIENRTFDELSIGDETSLSRTLTWLVMRMMREQVRCESRFGLTIDSETTAGREIWHGSDLLLLLQAVSA